MVLLLSRISAVSWRWEPAAPGAGRAPRSGRGSQGAAPRLGWGSQRPRGALDPGWDL